MRIDILLLVSCLIAAVPSADDKSHSLEPIVAAMDAPGFEVVFRPKPDKLAEQGISWEDVREEICDRRFLAGRWDREIKREIKGKTVHLAQVALIEVRNLRSLPFNVILPDGRVVRITPNAARFANYRIAGNWFESMVRTTLETLPAGADPAKAIVLKGVVNPGAGIRVKYIHPDPNYRKGHIATSIGEPLENVADVEVLDEARSSTMANDPGVIQTLETQRARSSAVLVASVVAIILVVAAVLLTWTRRMRQRRSLQTNSDATH